MRIAPEFFRILFILLIFAGGIGTIAYFVLWLLLPGESVEKGQAWDETLSQNAEEIAERARGLAIEVSQGFKGSHPHFPLYIGGTLVIFGIVFLIQTLNLVWLSWFRLEFLLASMLILVGVMLILRRPKEG
jgi:hypothetical protein